MKCKTRQLRFLESRPGGLSEDERRHLADCRECREFLAGMESLESEMHDLPLPEPPQHVDNAIMSEARARPGADVLPLPFGSFFFTVRFGAVAALILALVSLWVLWRTPLPGNGDGNGLVARPEVGEVSEISVETVLLDTWMTDFEQELWLLEAELEVEEQEAWLMIGQLWNTEVY